jgi:RimJ/RimL family protein N-acetyltransferase
MDPLLIDIPHEMETDRLLLRTPRAGEAMEINQAVRESIDQLKPWMPWAQSTPTLEETQIYCQQALAGQALRKEITYRLYLRDGGGLAGTIWMGRLNWSVPRFEFGYWTRTSMSGRGYMTEAVTALRVFALDKLRARRIEIRTDERNVRSRRVAERTGFELEGIMRNYDRFPADTVRNMCVYSIVASPAD